MTGEEGFNRQKKCRYGVMLYNRNDEYIGRSLDLYGEFSEGEVEIFRQIVKPDFVVLDIGANIGVHTLFFAGAVGPGGLVIAFEPQRLIHQTLCANMALNSIENTICLQSAVADKPGSMAVPLLNPREAQNFGGLELGSHDRGDQVAVTAIDGMGLKRCDFIKIDAEGMEVEVVRGGRRTLARDQPVLYVENDRKQRSAELIRLIDSLGYRQFWHLPPLFNADNFAGNQENVFGTIVSRNMLCVPKALNPDLPQFREVEVP